MNICEAGHKKHDRLVASTDVGDMTIYDWSKYTGFTGYCSGQDDISMTLDMYGRWEVEETLVARKVLELGDRNNLFIDIGSHVGWFSKLAQSVGYNRIIAYEGDLENIELFNKNTNNACLVTHTWVDDNTQFFIPDDVAIELVKIDIEGSESKAINALGEHIGNINNILMEVSPVFNDSYPQLIGELVERGFTPYFMNGDPFDFEYDFDQTNLLFVRSR